MYSALSCSVSVRTAREDPGFAASRLDLAVAANSHPTNWKHNKALMSVLLVTRKQIIRGVLHGVLPATRAVGLNRGKHPGRLHDLAPSSTENIVARKPCGRELGVPGTSSSEDGSASAACCTCARPVAAPGCVCACRSGQHGDGDVAARAASTTPGATGHAHPGALLPGPWPAAGLGHHRRKASEMRPQHSGTLSTYVIPGDIEVLQRRKAGKIGPQSSDTLRTYFVAL